MRGMSVAVPRARVWRGAVLALLLAAGLCAAEGDTPPLIVTAPAPASLDGKQVIAELDDLKVPAGTVWKMEKSELASRQARDPNFKPTEAERVKMRREIARNEIHVGLLVKYAQENKLTLTKEEEEKRIGILKEQLLQRGGKGYDAFLDGISKSDEEFRRINTAMQAVQNKLSAEITPEEIADFFGKVKAQIPLRRCSHVLYMYKGSARSTNERSKEEAQKLAEQGLADLKAGKTDMVKLATAQSDCPSKQQGGDLGWSPQTGQGAMVPAFANVLYALEKAGDLSAVVETEFGFHIIQLTGLRTQDDFKEPALQKLMEGRFQRFMQDLAQKNLDKIKLNETLLEVSPP